MEAALKERPRGFIVEFAGLPGSGKSTLAHAVAQCLREEGVAVSEPSYQINHRSKRWQRVLSKLWWVVCCGVADPRGSLEAVRSIAQSGQRSWTDLLTTSLNMLYLCGLSRALCRRPGIHLLDQGFVQQVWSVRFSASRPVPLAGLDRLARACFGPEGGAVIFVELEPGTAVDRLTARDGAVSRLERGLFGDTHAALLAAAGEALGEARGAVTALLGSRIRLETVKNDDGNDVEATAAGLARQMRAWWSAARSSQHSMGAGNGS